MSRPREALRARRAALVARAGVQRDAVVRRLDAWEKSFAPVDRGIAWLGAMRRKAGPLGVSLLALLGTLLVSRSGKIGSLLRGASKAFRIGRTAVGWVTALAALRR